MRALVASRVRPLLPSFEILQVPDGQADQGFFLLITGASALTPHLVVIGKSDKPMFLYPRRFGAESHWLGEAELADAFRNRVEAARGQEERLDAVHAEGLEKLWTEDTAWLTASIVPDVPGAMPLTNASLTSMREWGATVSQDLFPGPRFASVAVNNQAVGLRRVLLSTDEVSAAILAKYNYAQLHTDGVGFTAAQLVSLGGPDYEPLAKVLLAGLAAELVAMLGLLSRHAADNAGVAGDAAVQVELVEPDRRQTKGRRIGLYEEQPDDSGFLAELGALSTSTACPRFGTPYRLMLSPMSHPSCSQRPDCSLRT